MRDLRPFKIIRTKLVTEEFTEDARTPEEAESVVEGLGLDEEGTFISATLESIEAWEGEADGE